MKKIVYTANLILIFFLAVCTFSPQISVRASDQPQEPTPESEDLPINIAVKDVSDYTHIVYIDPSTSTPGNGSSAGAPLKSWDNVQIQANTAYIQKRGTTDHVSAPIIVEQVNVLLGAYGTATDPRPIISDASTDITHIIAVRSNFATVRDLEVISARATSGIYFAAGYWPTDGTVWNCSVHGVDKSHYLMWGIRVFGDRTRILNSQIYFIGDDGIFVQYFQGLEIAYNKISRVNQKWFEDTNETYSGGDGVQFDSTDNFHIHHNTVDRSDTGNKFCFIVDPKGDALKGGVIENNTCIVGSGVIPIFAGGASNYAITIRNNVLKSTAPGGGPVGIYCHALSPLIYNNIIQNFERGITLLNSSANAKIYHNDFYRIQSNGIWGDVASLTASNNIFDLNNGAEAISISPFSASYNLFVQAGQAQGSNPVVGDPQYVDSAAGNFKLQQTSPAVDAGIAVSGINSDAAGTAYIGAPDIGAFEFQPTRHTLFFTSNAAQDGWMLESGENSSLGGTTNATAAAIHIGDDAAKKQYRGILSFSTGADLPDNAIITGVVLKIQQQGISGGGNPLTAFQGLMVDIRNGFFGTYAALQAADFQAGASGMYGPFTPAPVGNLYSINLTAGKAFINRLASNSGLTQIRLRFKLDDNNNAVANHISLYSGEAPAANRPQLIVTYYQP